MTSNFFYKQIKQSSNFLAKENWDLKLDKYNEKTGSCLIQYVSSKRGMFITISYNNSDDFLCSMGYQERFLWFYDLFTRCNLKFAKRDIYLFDNGGLNAEEIVKRFPKILENNIELLKKSLRILEDKSIIDEVFN